jgi:hypothetical protein
LPIGSVWIFLRYLYNRPFFKPSRTTVDLNNYYLIFLIEIIESCDYYYFLIKRGLVGIILKDFCPVNSWKPDLEGEKWGYGNPDPMFLIDLSTNRRYFNEDEGTVLTKCFLLSLGTPIVHSIAAICNIAYRILKLVTLSHFWIEKQEGASFRDRLSDAGVDLLRIAAAVVTVVGLELSAIYGWFCPYDGRKLYATLERAEYGNFILAPCFQPDPQYHAFGGDLSKKNAF